MKVLVIGSGGREHALVWKLNQSKKVDKIFCAPGNGGISQMAKCVKVKVDSNKALSDFAHRNRIGLTVVGPEVPLARGIVDEFQRRKLKIFGPDKKAARIESSNIFFKELMRKHHIPTAAYRSFDTAAEAIGFLKTMEFPAVIKADGLAAGKGAVIAKDIEHAKTIINDMMVKRIFGKAGDRIIIERFLTGQEVSIMAITDGKTILPFLSSQDHKQAYDGDQGPNTGGMGAYCPTEFVSQELMEDIFDHILRPTMKALAGEGIKYKGVLYAGLMLTEDGPKVLEYNCRFGDPETQAILPLLKSDLCELMLATVNEKLAGFGKLSWHQGSAACVVMASKGYPGKYSKGKQITGLPRQLEADGCLTFHSGTEIRDKKLITTGGRVLGVTGRDKNLKAALKRAYKMIGKVKFDGAMYRKDIGFRAEKNTSEKESNA